MQTKGGSLPSRNDIAEQYKWRLEDIYSSDEQWEADFAEAEKLIRHVAALEAKLEVSSSGLLAVLEARDKAFQKTIRLFTYARMRLDEDNGNTHYQGLRDRADTLLVQAESAASYIVPWILSISPKTLKVFLEEDSNLKLYAHFLDDVGRKRDHTRPVAEERLLAEAGEIAQGPANVFRMLNDADLQFGTIIDETGQEVELTKGRFIHFMESRDRQVRRSAFETLYAEYGKYRNTWASMLSSNVKKNIFFSRARNYPSALAAALHADNVPTKVYDSLIDAVHGRMELLHRYMALRKKILGVDELHMYDVYAPLMPEVEFKIPYERAVQMVREAFGPLGSDYLNALEAGLSGGWVDVYESRGKTGGAYSWGVYGIHPYVLMSYQDNLDSAFTLAHELGHAMHTHYSNLAQPYVYSEYPIFVAEVASTLNEALLFSYLLETTEDANRRIYLLNYYCEQFRGAVYRQVMFAEFEREIHLMAERGEALTSESLCKLYHQLNESYYGPAIVVDEQIDMEWARIPHFYMGFYVYKYATGFSAATALSRQVLAHGKSARERYLRFLRSGGSDYPIRLLQNAGVDMTKVDPINQALDVFEDTLGELEQLLYGIRGES